MLIYTVILINYILRLAVPIIIGQLGGIITGLADTIMVGQHSTQELAATSFVNNVLNTFIIFGTGFSFALIPLVGENLAQDKRYVISAWLKNGIVANFLLSLVIFIMLANSFRQFVEGITNPSVSMWILLAGNLLNIIGNYALILEGGGLRGVFTCGVLDCFMDDGIRFPFSVGVSAGAC